MSKFTVEYTSPGFCLIVEDHATITVVASTQETLLIFESYHIINERYISIITPTTWRHFVVSKLESKIAKYVTYDRHS